MVLDDCDSPLGRAGGLAVYPLATLWLLKLNKATAMVFPSVIGVLLALRAIFIPRFFAARELLQMDTEMDI